MERLEEVMHKRKRTLIMPDSDDDEEEDLLEAEAAVVLTDRECENGHIVCSSCLSKLKRKCPFCNMRIDIRCRGLEKFLQSINILCKFAHNGCTKTMPYSKKIEHEQHLIFVCPVKSLCSYVSDVILGINMPHAGTERVVHKGTIGLLVCNEDPELTQSRARGWYLATRCTVHVCNSRDMFVDYEPVTGHEVILDHNSHVDVVGIGTVMLPLTTGKVLTLENVFHIPTITNCLISVIKLTDIGFGVSFGGEECAISKGRIVIGKGYKEDGLYRLGVLEENSGVKVLHDETIGLLVAHESPEFTKTRARGWYLATRCTVHVCNSRDMFVDYHPLNGHEVKLDFNRRAEVAGVGTVKLQLTTGKVWTLRNVFHMPKIIGCLLSFNKLVESNLMSTMSFENEGIVIKNGDELVGKAYEDGGLLRLGVVDERQDGIEGYDLSIYPVCLFMCRVQVKNPVFVFIFGVSSQVESNNRFHFGSTQLFLLTFFICLQSSSVFKMLKEMGFSLGFDAEGCYVKKGDQIVGNGVIEDGLFLLGVIDELQVEIRRDRGRLDCHFG
ncbi:hypothetical protein CTI12_AA255500 [Artemisia annua]|uniref:Retrovirus-related Pol polyprotein from transposon TNT 1-94-like beta-barrel domain-containing protein n=1 Tax=Artemisia annua TaxID=35608 RepID=A0A2U1NL21_ARTAN|nr:hypothetical protein CTI12_AA255500 [Artemisia annua]